MKLYHVTAILTISLMTNCSFPATQAQDMPKTNSESEPQFQSHALKLKKGAPADYPEEALRKKSMGE
jgi:hypothetical protein